MFDESEQGLDIDLKVLDLPFLHQPNSEFSKKLMDALKNVKSTKIFKNTSIQAIIRYQWTETRSFVWWYQIPEYILYFIFYMAYAIFSLRREHRWKTENPDEPYPTRDRTVEGCLFVPLFLFSIYFLIFEGA